MKNDEQRIVLSKLRISNHNLEIERGRHREDESYIADGYIKLSTN
jgi:hypothetical protein